MADFIRARSADQKNQRLNEIKAVAAAQFEVRPYHEITLTTIAEELGWSRASLYKYVTTKEEIFLELSADARDAYTEALLTAFPEGCGYSIDVAAEVWAGILNAHQDWLRYGDMLFTIVETNVTIERLMEFKRGYYDTIETVEDRFAGIFDIEKSRVTALLNTVMYHGVGMVTTCWDNPLVSEALERLGIERNQPDFRTEMRDFIKMCLNGYCTC